MNARRRLATVRIPRRTAARYKETPGPTARFNTGVMALDEIAGTPKYPTRWWRWKKFDWKPAGSPVSRGDHCVCQTYWNCI